MLSPFPKSASKFTLRSTARPFAFHFEKSVELLFTRFKNSRDENSAPSSEYFTSIAPSGFSPRKGVREAVLEYRILQTAGENSLTEITLHTGRTHQIRVQFASRKHPLAGDGKYGSRVKGNIALQSCGLQFRHPESGEPMAFTLPLPEGEVWTKFL